MSRVRFKEDFPPVPTEEWENNVRRERASAGIDESLLWHLPDGLAIRPYYREEDLQHLDNNADEAPPVGMPSSFLLRQDIATPDINAAREHVFSSITGGADIVGLRVGPKKGGRAGIPLPDRSAVAAFFEGLPLDNVRLHVDAGLNSPALGLLVALEISERYPTDDRAFTVAFDPVNEIVRRGRRLDHAFDLAAEMLDRASPRYPQGRFVRVGPHAFHSSGASEIQDIGLLLASVSELFVQLMERGMGAGRIAAHMYVSMPIGSSFFLEIARLRALRITLAQLLGILESSGDAAVPPIHGEMSDRPFTLYDPHMNLLRATSAAASAIVGGCDVVAVRSYDEPAGRYDEFGYRLARNVGHLLRDEARIGRVVDPGAGSYYVEFLTDAVGRRAWQLFQDIESRGGLLACLASGYISDLISPMRMHRAEAFGARRRVLIGANRFPNPSERRADDVPGLRGEDPMQTREVPLADDTDDLAEAFSDDLAGLEDALSRGSSITVLDALGTGPRLCDPFPSGREAEELERIRLRMEHAARKVRIVLLSVGSDGATRRSAQFAREFLACGGFNVQQSISRESVDKLSDHVRKAATDLLIVCGSDLLRSVADDVLEEVFEGIPVVVLALSGLVHEADDDDDVRTGRADASKAWLDLLLTEETDLIEGLRRLYALLRIEEETTEDAA